MFMKNEKTTKKVLAIVFTLIPVVTVLFRVILFLVFGKTLSLDERWIISLVGTAVAQGEFFWGLYHIIFSKEKLHANPLSLKVICVTLGVIYYIFFSTANTESFFFHMAPAYTVFSLLFPLGALFSKLWKKWFNKESSDQ